MTRSSGDSRQLGGVEATDMDFWTWLCLNWEGVLIAMGVVWGH